MNEDAFFLLKLRGFSQVFFSNVMNWLVHLWFSVFQKSGVEIINCSAWCYCQNLGCLVTGEMDRFCWAWKIPAKKWWVRSKLLGKQVGNHVCCWLLVVVVVGCWLWLFLFVVGCRLLLILESCQFHWELIVPLLELPKRSEPTRTDFNTKKITNPKDPWDWYVYLHLYTINMNQM